MEPVAEDSGDSGSEEVRLYSPVRLWRSTAYCAQGEYEARTRAAGGKAARLAPRARGGHARERVRERDGARRHYFAHGFATLLAWIAG